VVRNDASHSDILVQTDDETWQAYNSCGGNSLYTCSTNCPPGNPKGYRGASKVSYNRPWQTALGDDGHSWFMYAEYPMIRFLEENGYDVSYTSGMDVSQPGYASTIEQHKVFLTAGHDEYWSGQQRANVTAARDAGVNMAFFIGNEVFWKTRWEPSIDGSSTPNRTLVTYKEPTTTPPPIRRLNGTATHHLTLYRAASGALVFGAGTVQWSWGPGPGGWGRQWGEPRPARFSHAAGHGEPARRHGRAAGHADVGAHACHGVDRHDRAHLDDHLTISRRHPDGRFWRDHPRERHRRGRRRGRRRGGLDRRRQHLASGHHDVRGGHLRHLELFVDRPRNPTATIESRAVDDSGNLEKPSSETTVNVNCPARSGEPMSRRRPPIPATRHR
jgi:hypothetical protein